jgi:hypothetical protein
MGSKSGRLTTQWTVDDIVRDAKCVAYYLKKHKKAGEREFEIEFNRMWKSLCLAQYGSPVSIKEHVKKTQDREAHLDQLFQRATRACSPDYEHEAPMMSPKLKANWMRFLTWAATGEYPAKLNPPALKKKPPSKSRLRESDF